MNRDPQERIDELLAANVRFEKRARDAEDLVDSLRLALKEAYLENIQNAYNEGIERDGKWMDAAKSDPEWLERELGLAVGEWHDAAYLKERFDTLANRLVHRAEAGE